MTITDLRALLAKATPGPLKLHGCDEHGYTPDPGLLCYGVRGADRGYARTQADRELHCAAVNALPALLDVAEAAEAAYGALAGLHVANHPQEAMGSWVAELRDLGNALVGLRVVPNVHGGD